MIKIDNVRLKFNGLKSILNVLPLRFLNESFSYSVTIQYAIIRELPVSEGDADAVFIQYVPNVPAMLVELKRNQITGGSD